MGEIPEMRRCIGVSRFTQDKLQAYVKSSLGYSPWWLQLVTSPKVPDEPRPCCEKAPGELNLPEGHEKKSRSTLRVHHSCYACAPVAACKNHIANPLARAAWILSLQHCHRSLPSTLGSSAARWGQFVNNFKGYSNVQTLL